VALVVTDKRPMTLVVTAENLTDAQIGAFRSSLRPANPCSGGNSSPLIQSCNYALERRTGWPLRSSGKMGVESKIKLIANTIQSPGTVL